MFKVGDKVIRTVAMTYSTVLDADWIPVGHVDTVTHVMGNSMKIATKPGEVYSGKYFQLYEPKPLSVGCKAVFTNMEFTGLGHFASYIKGGLVYTIIYLSGDGTVCKVEGDEYFYNTKDQFVVVDDDTTGYVPPPKPKIVVYNMHKELA